MSAAGNAFEALLLRARAGDRVAMGELLQQYETPLRVYARVRLSQQLRQHADSVDLVNSVNKSLILALCTKDYTFGTPHELLGLAKRILECKISRLADRMRRQERVDSAENLAEFFDAQSGREPDPADVAEFHDAVRHVCARLSESEQQILGLRLQGYRQVEIAARLGIDPDLFRASWSRVTQRLRANGALKDWAHEE